MLIEATLGAVAEYSLEKIGDQFNKKEITIRLKQKLHLNKQPDDNFDSIYSHALVAYLPNKPEIVQDFFRNSQIRDAFVESYKANDFSILDTEAEVIAEAYLNRIKRGPVEYDPRREIANFRIVFVEILDLARSPLQVKLDHRIDDLEEKLKPLDEFGEMVEYLGSLWIDRQMIYSWDWIVETCSNQLNRALIGYSNQYLPHLYVTRTVDNEFIDFLTSDEVVIAFVDRAGTGKTNLLCSLASRLQEQGKPAILIRGDSEIADDHGLERLIMTELGLDNEYQKHFNQVGQSLARIEETLFVFIDGLSEADDLKKSNRALRNLISMLVGVGTIKLCLCARDRSWQTLSYDLPMEHFFQRKSEDETFIARYFTVGDFDDEEFNQALDNYRINYDVDFNLTSDAEEQLKHPFILRLFSETYAGSNLGTISELPVATIFGEYLQIKTEVISHRLEGSLRPGDIRKYLKTAAGKLWEGPEPKPLDIYVIKENLPNNLTLEEYRRLVNLLEEEGIIRIVEQPFTSDYYLEFEFSQFQDYLLLEFLLALHANDLDPHASIVENTVKLVQIYSPEPNSNLFKLLTLIGMMMPNYDERRECLAAMLEWDFQTYCACLSFIPPSGIRTCNAGTMGKLARKLVESYSELISKQFSFFLNRIDPRYYRTNDSHNGIGIRLRANIDCKEVSYNYEAIPKGSENTKINITDAYPTWSLTFGGQEVHDPEKGISINNLRINDPENGQCLRVINQTMLPFPGASFGVPERIALFDIWVEIKNLIDQRRIQIEPKYLIAERAWAIAEEVLEPEAIHNLTYDELVSQKEKILAVKSAESLELITYSNKLDELAFLLSRLDSPLSTFELKHREFTATGFDRGDYSAQQITDHIAHIVQASIGAYKTIVKRNFLDLAEVLNIFANLPFSLYIFTDLTSMIKLFSTPEEQDSEMGIKVYPVDEINEDLVPRFVNPPVGDEPGESITFRQLHKDELDRLGRNRPPLEMIAEVEPLDAFFSNTPVDHLVYKWLSADLARVFGFL